MYSVRYLVCDMIYHFVALPLIFYPMHFLWKRKVTLQQRGPLKLFNNVFLFRVTSWAVVTLLWSWCLWQLLYSDSTGCSTKLPPIKCLTCKTTLVSVPPPGLITLVYTSLPGTVSNPTWWLSLLIDNFLSILHPLGWSPAWICSSPQAWQVCQYSAKCQSHTLAGNILWGEWNLHKNAQNMRLK